MPPRRETGPQPPRTDRVDPGVLAAAGAEQWQVDADLEGLEISGVDVETITLDGATVRSCRWADLSARGAWWRSTRFLDTVLERVAVPVVRAPRTVWRDVRIEGARLGSVEAYESTWRSVHLIGCKIDFLDLRSAELLDVALTDCIVGELDLGGATARRVSFRGTRLGRLEMPGATCEHVDLRGAELSEIVGLDGLRGTTIDTDQLTRLAPVLARDRDIEVLDDPPGR